MNIKVNFNITVTINDTELVLTRADATKLRDLLTAELGSTYDLSELFKKPESPNTNPWIGRPTTVPMQYPTIMWSAGSTMPLAGTNLTCYSGRTPLPLVPGAPQPTSSYSAEPEEPACPQA